MISQVYIIQHTYTNLLSKQLSAKYTYTYGASCIMYEGVEAIV